MPRRQKQQNNLRQARDRAGLERKQVAFLLSKKGTDELSRHENGDYSPNLQTALKLEIIYKTPIRFLFPNLFEELETEIAKLKKENPALFPKPDWFPQLSEQLKLEEYCFYGELLQSHIPNELELRNTTKHILALNNMIIDLRQAINPFSERR